MIDMYNRPKSLLRARQKQTRHSETNEHHPSNQVFRPMNMSNPPCQFVGSLNKGHISCGNWEKKVKVCNWLYKEVWRRAEFECIMFVAFDGYTFEDKMHERRSIMDMEVNSIQTKLVWFYLFFCAFAVIQTDVIPSNKEFLHILT